jgi:mitogen-activated protein kinase 7
MTTHQRHTLFKVLNQEFWVDNKFRITKELGQGAYGIVWCVPNPFCD